MSENSNQFQTEGKCKFENDATNRVIVKQLIRSTLKVENGLLDEARSILGLSSEKPRIDLQLPNVRELVLKGEWGCGKVVEELDRARTTHKHLDEKYDNLLKKAEDLLSNEVTMFPLK